MKTKFYNTYIPLTNKSGDIAIPVYHSHLNISFRIEYNLESIKIYDYSYTPIHENKTIHKFFKNISNNLNSIQDEILKIITSGDDNSRLYFISIACVLYDYKTKKIIFDEILKNMENKNIGSSFINNAIIMNQNEYELQKGKIAIALKDFKNNAPLLKLKCKKNEVEKFVENEFIYDHLKKVCIYDCNEIENIACTSVICI